MRYSIQRSIAVFVSMLGFSFLAGCHSHEQQSATKPSGAPISNVEAAAAPKMTQTIRVKAGVTTPFTDSAGNVWQPDKGFDGGDTIERDASLQVANTKDPAMFRTEHFGMNSFTQTLPNGKYTVKLYFAETYEGITGAGQRVFSFDVNGKTFKDFDIFVKAGGAAKAYIETVPVDVTDGKLTLTFTPNIENPEINAIEIIPTP
jgi:endoglucanase